MKNSQLVLGVIGVFFLSVLFLNCGGTKTDNSEYVLTENPPFSIEEVYSQKWMAGVKDGGSGINIYLKIKNVEPGTLVGKVYFRKKITSIEKEKDQSYVGYFKNDAQDIVMESNTKKEAGNTPPEKIPFQLEENEAVISYTYKGIVNYFKITSIEEKEVIAYPSSNPNSKN